jgi:hypothetical protein
LHYTIDLEINVDEEWEVTKKNRQTMSAEYNDFSIWYKICEMTVQDQKKIVFDTPTWYKRISSILSFFFSASIGI